MSELGSILGFSLAVTGPIFLLLGLGVWLRRLGMLTDAFVNSGSELVFKIALPSLLFFSVLKADIGQSANLPLVGYGLAATVAIFVGLDLLSPLLVHPAPSAAASYVMVRAMGGNGALAANIVALTSLGSLVTTAGAITLLRALDLM